MKDIIFEIRQWLRRNSANEHIKDGFTFLFFLMLSVAFWFFYNLNDDFEVKVDVPLVLKDVPEDVLITTPLPSHVMATISGRGTALLQYQTNAIPSIDLDFKVYDKGVQTGFARVPMTDIRMQLEKQIPSGTRLGDVIADTLEFYYNRGVSRRLPIRMQGHISTASHNYLRSVRLRPDSVQVFAPQEVLDTMTFAYTQQFTLMDLSKSDIYNVGFKNLKGVYYQPSHVQINLDVDFYTEKTVRIPVREVNFPAGVTLRTFPSEVSVTFRIGASKYNSISPQDFLILVSYEELLQNESPKFRLHLKSVPDGVSNIRIRPAEVDYLIERSDAF